MANWWASWSARLPASTPSSPAKSAFVFTIFRSSTLGLASQVRQQSRDRPGNIRGSGAGLSLPGINTSAQFGQNAPAMAGSKGGPLVYVLVGVLLAAIGVLAFLLFAGK